MHCLLLLGLTSISHSLWDAHTLSFFHSRSSGNNKPLSEGKILTRGQWVAVWRPSGARIASLLMNFHSFPELHVRSGQIRAANFRSKLTFLMRINSNLINTSPWSQTSRTINKVEFQILTNHSIRTLFILNTELSLVNCIAAFKAVRYSHHEFGENSQSQKTFDPYD